MGARARLLLLGVLTIIAAVLGTRAGRHAQGKPGGTEVSAVALEPVPVPEGILADAVVPSPDATWRKAQTAIGGVIMLAPPTFGGVLAAFSGALQLSGIVDGQSPAYAVVDDQGRYVIAAHVVTASRARSTLLEPTGPNAPFAPFTIDSRVSDIEILHAAHTWLGLVQTWVLVGSDRDAIVALGPYAHRNLPKRELPHSAAAITATSAALAGPIRAELDQRWSTLERFLLDKDEEQRRLHGGRPPDLADPKPLVAAVSAFAKRQIAIVTAMKSVDVALDVDADAVDARVTMTPPSGGEDNAVTQWMATADGGSASALSTSSADALATLFWRSDAPEREATAKDFGDTLTRSLGTRVPAPDVTRLVELFGRASRARADWSMASITAGSSPGALLRLSTTDAPSLLASVEGAVDVAGKPTWATWEKDALSIKKVARTGAQATFDTEGPHVQAAWESRDGEVDVAVGLDATSVLTSAAPSHTLASDAKTSAWLHAIGDKVVWAVAARPLLLNTTPRSDPACVALVKSGHTATLYARATGAVLRQVVTSTKGR